MNTFGDIFEKLGGTGAVARAIEVGHSTASEMRRRKSIPVKYWPALIAFSKTVENAELDTDMLVRLHIEASEQPTPTEGKAA